MKAKPLSLAKKAGQSEAVIAGEKTAGEVLKEQKQARLTEARINANKALDKMWEIFHQSELGNRISPDDFMKAACEHHTNWGVGRHSRNRRILIFQRFGKPALTC